MPEQPTAFSDEVRIVRSWLTRAKAIYLTDPIEARKCLEETDQYVRNFGIGFTSSEQSHEEYRLREEMFRFWLCSLGKEEEALRRVHKADIVDWLCYAECLKESNLAGSKAKVMNLLVDLTKTFTRTMDLLHISVVGLNLFDRDYHAEFVRVLGLAESNGKYALDFTVCADGWLYSSNRDDETDAIRCMLAAERVSQGDVSNMVFTAKRWKDMFPKTYAENSLRCLRKAEEMATDCLDHCYLAEGWKQIFDNSELARRHMLMAEVKATSRKAWELIASTWLDELCDLSAYKRCLQKAETYPDLDEEWR